MKTKKKFLTDKFDIVNKSGKRFAVATAPSGAKAWRIVAKTFKA